MTATIACDQRGTSGCAYICTHLLKSLNDSISRGLTMELDDDGNPNAWCDGCERKLVMAGDVWTDELSKFADISVVCRECYQSLESVNLGRRELQ
jgi:hypothetical protein